MKLGLLIYVLISSYLFAMGQNENTKFQNPNSIQVGLSGGNSYFIPLSINYERIVAQFSKTALSTQIGGTYFKWNDKKQKAVTLEFGILNLNKKNHWEAGMFFMLQDSKTNIKADMKDITIIHPPWYLAARFGYRYQRPAGKWLFRLGLQFPFLQKKYDNNAQANKVQLSSVIIPWPSITLGRVF